MSKSLRFRFISCVGATAILTGSLQWVSAGSDDAVSNWPQWRGPVGTGVSPDGNPPTEWSETKNVKWKVRVPGEGTATPIVWGDHVFISAAIPNNQPIAKAADRPASPATASAAPGNSRMIARFDSNKDGKVSRSEVPAGALRRLYDRIVEQYKLDAEKIYTVEELQKVMGIEADPPAGGGGFGGFGRSAAPTQAFQFVVLCLDRNTGSVLWRKTVAEQLPHEGHHPDGSFAAASPVTDGTHIFAYFGSWGLHCLDLSGQLVWSQDFGDQRMQNSFGEGSSPALVGDAVVVKWDHEGDSFLIAVDKKTGATIWRKPREERSSWSTPLIVEYDGKPQIVTTASRRVRSYDPESGDVIWECSGLGPNVIPSPVAGNGMVFAVSGFQRSALLAITLGARGDVSATDSIAWRLDRGTPYVPSPMLYDSRLYFFTLNNPILTCINARDGKPLFESQRVGGLQGVYASPIGAAGRVYLVGRGGSTVVIRNADQFEVLATNRLDDRFDASPAVVGSMLFLRGREHVYCIAE